MGFFVNDEGDFNVKRVFKFGAVGAIILVGLIVYLTNVYTVQTGEVAIVSTNGNISRVDGPGLHFKYPLIQSKVFMETREKSYIFGKTDEQDTTLEVSTKDMQSIKLEFTVQANIQDPEKLYTNFGMKYQERFVRPRVKEIVQATIAKYTIEEFVTKRAQISTEIFNDLQDDFARYGMVVSNVSIVNHDFSDEYEKAIEAKKVAEQKVETAKAESAKAQVEAENRVKLAEYALREKELQAKANEIESNSLTPQLLRKMTIEKWNGQLPKVQGSSNSLIKIDE
jgi:transporter, stomatin/podocin/band 7/nephrosis.2/SPFH family